MGYQLIEITHDKVEDLSENIEQALRYAGKAMQCIDEIKQQHPGMMGQRRWGNQYGSGRMGMRYPDEMGYRGGGNMGNRQPYPEHPDYGYRDPMMF